MFEMMKERIRVLSRLSFGCADLLGGRHEPGGGLEGVGQRVAGL